MPTEPSSHLEPGPENQFSGPGGCSFIRMKTQSQLERAALPQHGVLWAGVPLSCQCPLLPSAYWAVSLTSPVGLAHPYPSFGGNSRNGGEEPCFLLCLELLMRLAETLTHLAPTARRTKGTAHGHGCGEVPEPHGTSGLCWGVQVSTGWRLPMLAVVLSSISVWVPVYPRSSPSISWCLPCWRRAWPSLGSWRWLRWALLPPDAEAGAGFLYCMVARVQ